MYCNLDYTLKPLRGQNFHIYRVKTWTPVLDVSISCIPGLTVALYFGLRGVHLKVPEYVLRTMQTYRWRSHFNWLQNKNTIVIFVNLTAINIWVVNNMSWTCFFYIIVGFVPTCTIYAITSLREMLDMKYCFWYNIIRSAYKTG